MPFAHTHLDRLNTPICQRAWVSWMEPFASYQQTRGLRRKADPGLDDVPEVVAVDLCGQRAVALHHQLAHVVEVVHTGVAAAAVAARDEEVAGEPQRVAPA